MKLSATVTCLLFIAQSLYAGQSGVGLRAIVVEGNGARNIVEQIPPTPMVVRIVDRENHAVRGATVVFTSPETGPSGDFANDLTSFTAFTNEDGLASAPQFHPNGIEGAYQIRVRAQYRDEVAETTIRQINVGAKRSFKKTVIILAVAGAAAGAAMASRGSGSSSQSTSPSTTTPSSGVPAISFGTSTVGGPQ